MKGLKIGNVELENRYTIRTHGRRHRPAISSALQRTGGGASVHGDGERKGDYVQQPEHGTAPHDPSG